MWGIIPAAGLGSRIQPLAFSKELLPVGSRIEGNTERPRAVSEYLLERMLAAGTTQICFVIAPGKSDILEYYGSGLGGADFCYVVQPRAGGLCDAIFRARGLIGADEAVLVGLPDTVWFPVQGLSALDANDPLSFLLFPVSRPEFFDAVVTNEAGEIREIQVKRPNPATNWIWGAFRLTGRTLHELYALWCERGQQDEFIGTLVNAWIERGGKARGVRAGEAYVDVGTIHGYREALHLLATYPDSARARPLAPGVHVGRASTRLRSSVVQS